jgi:hypothetical protein
MAKIAGAAVLQSSLTEGQIEILRNSIFEYCTHANDSIQIGGKEQAKNEADAGDAASTSRVNVPGGHR